MTEHADLIIVALTWWQWIARRVRRLQYRRWTRRGSWF